MISYLMQGEVATLKVFTLVASVRDAQPSLQELHCFSVSEIDLALTMHVEGFLPSPQGSTLESYIAHRDISMIHYNSVYVRRRGYMYGRRVSPDCWSC